MANLINEISELMDEEAKMNTKGKRNLDRSNRLEMLFGKKKDLNPFHKPSRTVENPTKSSLEPEMKGSYRMRPSTKREGWTGI